MMVVGHIGGVGKAVRPTCSWTGRGAHYSDCDLPILVDGPVDHQREHAIVRRLFELELETDTVITASIHRREEWKGRFFEPGHFMKESRGRAAR